MTPDGVMAIVLLIDDERPVRKQWQLFRKIIIRMLIGAGMTASNAAGAYEHCWSNGLIRRDGPMWSIAAQKSYFGGYGNGNREPEALVQAGGGDPDEPRPADNNPGNGSDDKPELHNQYGEQRS